MAEEPKDNRKKVEKLVDLGDGSSIWRVHIDALREQDKNARVMPLEKFDRLTANIAKDKRLESFPLVTPSVSQGGHQEFSIISGHHRVRAARAAGMQFIPVISLDEQLSKDQIIAKQLSHNALNGFDDPILLQELYSEISDINAKLESGIFESDLKIELPSIPADDLKFDFDYELLQIFFLPRQKEKFEGVLKLMEKDTKVFLADRADFERMKYQMIQISKHENIRNVAAIISKMIEIVEEHYENKNHDNA